MMMNRKILLAGVLCFVSVIAFGNDVDTLQMLQDSITDLNKRLTALEKGTKPLIKWWESAIWFFGIALAVLGYFGISTKLNLKKVVNEQLNKEANRLVTEEFANKIKANPEVVDAFFQDLQRKNDIKTQKRFLIISKNRGKQGWLNGIFERNGFNTKNLDYRSFEEAKNIDTNDFDYVLYNNSVKAKLEEKEVKTTDEIKSIFGLMEQFNGKLDKQFYLGEHIPNTYLGKCKSMGVSFTTMPSYLTDNILSNS